MSYYKPSFSQTVAMSRGSGRGFASPRGSSSYRGSRGSSSWGDRGSRGGFSSNRGGRFSSSWNSSNSAFESRSRYPSSSGGGDRYGSNSRNRPDDSSYRRSYRSDAANNYTSSRDASTHRSPDRKRMRNEAPSSRRSHDGGYGGGDGYSGSGNASRYESSQGGYSERRSFAEDRRPAFRGRDDYRKPVSMPSGGSSVRQSPRGGYRGRAGGSRGHRGARLSLRDGVIRRRVVDTGYLRKRGAPLRSTSDYLRRLKISRLRSIASRRAMKSRNEKSKSSEKDDSDKDEENWDDDKDDEKKKEDSEKNSDSEKKKSTPTKKSSPKKEKEKGKDDSDKDEKKSASDDEDRPRSRFTGRPFIRLTCTHCNMKCVTFKEYSNHLFNSRHIQAMRKIAIKQKSALSRMRLTQRNAQRELEKNDDSLASRTNFCPLCKLNYRQLKSKHQLSDAHRNMKKFLMPYCRVCHITFKSPMLYENHMCSLEHIKRKAQSDLLNGDKHGSDKEPPSPTEEELENFMTLDSVGDVDEDVEGGKTPKSPTEEGADADAAAKNKETINVGAEHVKKVEVHYCDLCRIYLSRYDSPDRAIKQHCRGRMHLQRYVRYKEDKDLRRQAERIHRKSQEAKEAKEKEKDKTKKDDKDGDKDEEENKDKEDKNEEDAGDDKMWADVDKDLGEILAEVNTEGGNKSSDEDEDSRPDGERYDRFRYSSGKKNGEGEVKKVDGDEEKDETEENENEEDKDGNNEEEDDNKNDEEEEEEEEKDDTESASGK